MLMARALVVPALVVPALAVPALAVPALVVEIWAALVLVEPFRQPISVRVPALSHLRPVLLPVVEQVLRNPSSLVMIGPATTVRQGQRYPFPVEPKAVNGIPVARFRHWPGPNDPRTAYC